MEFYEVGQKVKTLRKEQHFSQSDLAKQVGISRQTLSKLEKGNIDKVSLQVFIKIIDHLGQELIIEERKPFYYFDPKSITHAI